MPAIKSGFDQEGKVFRTRGDNGYEFTVKADKFDGNQSELMSKAGYRGDYIMFTVVAGGQVYSHYDPRKLRDKHPLLESGMFTYDLLCGLHDGDIEWTMIIHDSEYTEAAVRELLNDR